MVPLVRQLVSGALPGYTGPCTRRRVARRSRSRNMVRTVEAVAHASVAPTAPTASGTGSAPTVSCIAGSTDPRSGCPDLPSSAVGRSAAARGRSDLYPPASCPARCCSRRPVRALSVVLRAARLDPGRRQATVERVSAPPTSCSGSRPTATRERSSCALAPRLRLSRRGVPAVPRRPPASPRRAGLQFEHAPEFFEAFG